MRALVAVEKGSFLEEALDVGSLQPKDRGLAWFIANGVLRHRRSIDSSLRPLLRAPLGGLDAEVRATLRAGTFERLYGRAAAHAVVHEAVETARAVGAGRASGLVNAVLRRVALPADLERGERLEHPDWLIERWTKRYGAEATDDWCSSNNLPPPLTLAGPRLVEIRGELEGLGYGVSPAHAANTELPDALTVKGHRGPIEALPGFAEGAFWVQDPAAIAVADLLDVEPGSTVLDACAAPGGKTFRLASRGADVLAVDRSEGRLSLVSASLERLKLGATTRLHDWTQGSLQGAPRFDFVLVDAPCSALGTLRRRPEIRWRRHPEDLEGAAQRQRAILEATLPHLREGGTLVYAVCSPEPEEAEAHVATLAERAPELELVRRWSSSPPAHGEDAHQALIWRRRGS